MALDLVEPINIGCPASSCYGLPQRPLSQRPGPVWCRQLVEPDWGKEFCDYADLVAMGSVGGASVRYRGAFHAEHAFAGGLAERVVGILVSFEDPVPSIEVDRWEPWPDRLTAALGVDHPDTLATRHNLASSYWSAGRTGEAITLKEQVLADSERILGVDHPDTLGTRESLAVMLRDARPDLSQ